jgi:hypothetical protein
LKDFSSCIIRVKGALSGDIVSYPRRLESASSALSIDHEVCAVLVIAVVFYFIGYGSLPLESVVDKVAGISPCRHSYTTDSHSFIVVTSWYICVVYDAVLRD